MKKKESQKQTVKDFFNNISEGYQEKYNNTNTFLHYFFQQRLHEATHSLTFERKSILDIGAGTGALFHFLKNKFNSFQYFATDISPKMLEQSGIPSNKYFVGTLADFPSLPPKYDYIFLLGVTTYFSPQELDDHFNFIQQHLHADGIAIISFTNRNSIDFKIRQVVRFFTRFFNFKKNVMGQSFDIFAYSTAEVFQKTKNQFSLQKVIFLNQTYPPFNRIFPKKSIWLADLLKRRVSSPALLSWCSSDFLVFLKPQKSEGI